MNRNQGEQSIRMSVALVVLAILYTGLLQYFGTLTGRSILDGSIGVLLGLYICSHPAASFVSMLFRMRGGRRRSRSTRSNYGLLALNLLVLAAGWLVIVAGISRLLDRRSLN